MSRARLPRRPPIRIATARLATSRSSWTILTQEVRFADMKIVIDLIIAFLTLGLTYVLTSEGLWGSALMFFNVLFAAMIAFNFYEPLARLIDQTGINWGFSDTLCMLGIVLHRARGPADDDRDHRAGHGEVPDARLSCRPARLRAGWRSGDHGRHRPGFPRGTGSQEDLQRDRSQIQTSVWVRARSSVAGVLSI